MNDKLLKLIQEIILCAGCDKCKGCPWRFKFGELREILDEDKDN